TEMIETAGGKIPPEQIEDLLMRRPDVKDAAAIGVERNGAQELWVVIVPRGRVAKPAKYCAARCGICSARNKKCRPASRAAFSVGGKLEFPGGADAGHERSVLEACDATAAVRRLGLAEIGVQGFDFQDAVVRDGVLHAAACDPAGAPSRLVRGVAGKIAEQIRGISDFAEGQPRRA